MSNVPASHDGLPDNIAPERLLAKKIKAGTATAYEALQWLRITATARKSEIATMACDLIEDDCFVINPTHSEKTP